jgi:hypothetical protein
MRITITITKNASGDMLNMFADAWDKLSPSARKGITIVTEK